MIHTLCLRVQNRPAVLERLLRVTRHRGFEVTGMTVRPDTPERFDISLAVTGERPIHTLLHQLEKLHEVTHVGIREDKAMRLKVANGR